MNAVAYVVCSQHTGTIPLGGKCLTESGVRSDFTAILGNLDGNHPSPHFYEPGGLGGPSATNIIFFSGFVHVPISLQMPSTKSIMSQKLKNAKLSNLVRNPFQNIAHPLGGKK